MPVAVEVEKANEGSVENHDYDGGKKDNSHKESDDSGSEISPAKECNEDMMEGDGNEDESKECENIADPKESETNETEFDQDGEVDDLQADKSTEELFKEGEEDDKIVIKKSSSENKKWTIADDDDLFDDEKSDEETVKSNKDFEEPLKDNLFEQSEESDDDDDDIPISSRGKRSKAKHEDSHVEKDDLALEEENFSLDEEESLESLKNKFKSKGKTSPQSPTKKMRPSKKLKMQIHSDSQRMTRESRVKLPYHAPATKPISFFLKRIPRLGAEDKETIKAPTPVEVPDSCADSSSAIEDTQSVIKDQPTEPTATPDSTRPNILTNPPSGNIASPAKSYKIKAVVASAGLPKLSASTDPFFFDQPKPPKPKGMDNFIQRFMKHSVKPKPVLKSDSDQKAGPSHESTSEVVPDDPIVKPKVTPLIAEEKVSSLTAPGSRLSFLKNQLSQKMKQQRAVQRKVWESQRKMDNEEFSEEEEEDMTDEESDDEIDKWNEDDIRKQKEREEEENDEDDENDEDWPGEDLDDGTVESGDDAEDEDSDQEGSNNDNLMKHRKPKPNILMDSKEATMDLYSSDNWSNHSTNTKEFDNDKFAGLRLRLDSTEESIQTDLFGESTKSFSRLKDSSGSLFSDLNSSRENFKFAAPSESTMDSTYSFDSKKSIEWNMETSLDCASIPPGQGERTGEKSKTVLSRQTTPDIFTPFSRIQHLLKSDNTSEKISKRLSEISPPIEDSQDLFEDETEILADKQAPSSPVVGSQDFHFSLDEDTQCGEFLNTQGYLISKKPSKPKASKDLFGSSEPVDTQSNMSELLGLCSGKFTEEENRNKNMFKPISESNTQENLDELLGLCSGKFGDSKSSQNISKTISDTQQNMEELLGICSGKFSSQTNDNSTLTQEKASETNTSKEEEDEEDEFVFGDDEDYGKKSKKRNVFSDDEESDDEDEDEGAGEEEVKDIDEMDEEEQAIYLMSKKYKKYGKTYEKIGKKFKKKNFLEEEAELSGSEVGSDENEDGNSDDDMYEEDSDVEDLPSNEELKKQVNQVHLKSVLDQDKVDLRTFQEMFLKDGDLYSDGKRTRNFRWAGIDDNSQVDLFNNGSDDEDRVVIETEEELQRRKQRHEKETYLMENRAKIHEVVDLDESSQSILNIINDTSRSAPSAKILSKNKVQTTPPKIVPVKKKSTSLPRRGSFLNLGKQKLSMLSTITANKPNVSGPTRGFVFQTVSPSASKRPKMQRSSSASDCPSAKRPRLERSMSSLPHGSIFSVMQQS